LDIDIHRLIGDEGVNDYRSTLEGEEIVIYVVS
jgi:hypothetical protein